jgi:uncharacterized tellurite resistance protein B-like protein
MYIASLRNVLKAFGGEELDPAERNGLVKEVLLLALACGSSSDTNVASIEVSTVRKVIKDATGEDLSEADVRIAASLDLFETESVESMLDTLCDELAIPDRVFVMRKLEEVLRSDTRISEFEIDYYNRIAEALDLRPSELAGLIVA